MYGRMHSFRFGLGAVAVLCCATMLIHFGCDKQESQNDVVPQEQLPSPSETDTENNGSTTEQTNQPSVSTIWYSGSTNIDVLGLMPLAVPFDVNGDESDDFVFYSSDLSAEFRCQNGSAAAGPLESQRVIDSKTEGWFMDKQQMISWMGLYDGNGDLVSSGPWSKVTGYMGLKFVANGLTHYGWAQIAGGARLLGWAYETRPGVGIKAGQVK